MELLSPGKCRETVRRLLFSYCLDIRNETLMNVFDVGIIEN